MKARESGMPEEEIWESFFNTNNIFEELEINAKIKILVEFGCGYGTFTIPSSKKIAGNLYAYDIEPSLVKEINDKLIKNNINNVSLFNRDFILEGTGLINDFADYVMLFNILHAEESEQMLKETFRVLKKKGRVGIIHWNYDESTPRGPSMKIRPKPEEIKIMLIKAGFSVLKFNINLPPYHYGILAEKLI